MILSQVADWCHAHRYTPDKGPIVVALSGGPDSVALLYCLNTFSKQYGVPLAALTIDHGWRVDSQEDVVWCAQLCASLDIPHYSAHIADVPDPRRSRGSPEEDARYARRYWYEQYARQLGAQAIALGHHADDQLETFLVRLIRGAGLSGLAGMNMQDGLYIRPLLPYGKQELIDFLKSQGATWRTDSTNTDLRYLRNRIRHILLPALRETDERASECVLRAIGHLHDARDAQAYAVAHACGVVLLPDNTLRRDLFAQLPATLQYEVLIVWLRAGNIRFTPQTSFIAELTKLLDPARSERTIPFDGWRLQLGTQDGRPTAYYVKSPT